MAFIERLLERIDTAVDSMGATLAQRPAYDEDDDRARSPSGSGETVDDGSLIINGVPIPATVADQLRQLGLSLSWYSKGELEAAINGCSVDCNLVDDPNGVTFFDDIMLDGREHAENTGEIDFDPYRMNTLNPTRASVFEEPEEFKFSAFYDSGFRDRIKAEREGKKNALADGNDRSDASLSQCV